MKISLLYRKLRKGYKPKTPFLNFLLFSCVLKKTCIVAHFLFVIAIAPVFAGEGNVIPGNNESKEADASLEKTEQQQLFDSYSACTYLDLNEYDLNYEVFKTALKGYFRLKGQEKLENDSIITIVDFTKSSNDKRLFIIDLNNKQVLHKTYVAHGMKTGQEFAKTFSNEENSHQSSLGFYTTDITYHGRRGYSLKLDGQEGSFNTNARKRGVVVHGAEYVSEQFIKENIRLGRSQGCPAVPLEENKKIIGHIKDKSCFFIYYPDRKYLKYSRYINNDNYLNYVSEAY